MKKSLLILLFCCISVLFLSAAALGEPERCPYDIHLSIMYNYMTPSQQKLFDRLYDAVRNGKAAVQVPSGMTRDEVHWLLDDFVNEASELCAFDFGSTEIISRSGSVKEIRIGYRFSTAEQEKYIREVTQLARQVAGKTEKNGIRAVHDYVIKLLDHYYDNGDPDDLSRALQSYYALKTHRAVCNGYAQTTAMLCHFAGYTCSYIDGHVADERGQFTVPHAWNAAVIDGKFTWMDVTWDDAGQKANTDWYNMTGSQMGKTHFADPEYKDFATRASILPDNVSFTMYLDLYDQKGYVRGITDQSRKSYKLNRLQPGQYYAPAVVIWNQSSKPVPVTVSYRIDTGIVYRWSQCSVQNGSNIAFRSYEKQLAGQRGTHQVTWYCDGNRLGTFTWKTE